MSNVLLEVESWWGDAEADVAKFLAAIVAGEQASITAITKAQNWLSLNAPTILEDAQAIIAGVESVAGILDPSIVPEIQTAIALLQNFLASEQANSQTVGAVAAGYAAVSAVNGVAAKVASSVATAAVAKSA